MNVSYQLSPVNLPSKSSRLSSPGIELTVFGYVTGSNQRLYPLRHVSLRTHDTVDKDRNVMINMMTKMRTIVGKNLKNVHYTSSQKYRQIILAFDLIMILQEMITSWYLSFERK